MWIGADVQEYEGDPFCEVCESDLVWRDCDQCGGEGEFDWEALQEEDPLWYQPGDTERCEQCGGAGGWYVCPSCRERPEDETQ
jgi:hypothetical protein